MYRVFDLFDMGLFGSDDVKLENADIDCEPQGEYVTEERVAKLDGILDEGESVHYLTKGSKVTVKGDGSGFGGNDKETKAGTKGKVRAAFTDGRVAIKIPQLTGSDEQTIPYDTVTSVDLDSGLVTKELKLQTEGYSYEIKVEDPGKEECRDITKFVRERRSSEGDQTVVAESDPDPTEQLQRLKELHEDGVVSDEEFEEKKEDLMDRL